MRTDHELETLLRATFANRSASVRQGPRWTPPVRTPRHRRWLPVLAAAAAVVLLAVGLAVGPRLVDNSHPAHPSPSVTPTLKKTAPPPPAIPQACTTPLPAAWQRALSNSQVDLGAMAATLDDIGPDGTLVVSRDFGVTPGSARDIVLVAPGKAPRVVYRVIDPDKQDATAALAGHWLVIAINSHGRAPANTVPNFPPPTIYRLLVRDLDTGTTRQIASAPEGNSAPQTPLIEAFTVLGGRVYWTYHTYGSPTGEVRSYDPRTSKTSTVYRGSLGDYPEPSAAGIGSFDATGYVAPGLPAQVAQNLGPNNPIAVGTDGRSWAWVKSAHVLGWWQPGMTAPRYVQLRQAVTPNDGPPSVAGPYVFINQQVVDMNTRALAALPDDGKFGSFEPQAGHDGILYGAKYVGSGHWVGGYWQDPQPQVQRVDTRTLPALQC